MKAATRACSGHQAPLLTLISFILGGLACYTLRQRDLPLGGIAASGILRAAARPSQSRFHHGPCPPPRQPGSKTRNLVFAAVGDKWSPSKWSFSGQANWDLIAVYFGNRTDWDCAECTLALRMPDSFKWRMVWALMEEAQPQWKGIWKRLQRRYDYVMVADDDLAMDACAIDTLFDRMRRHQLLAAQLSNCRGNDSDNPYWVHWKLPGLELHHVNVVEVTAPALHMPFLHQHVGPLLQHSYSGWGLPFCFSALTGFSRDKLAAVDAACMVHPAREEVGRKMLVSDRIRLGLVKPGSIYARFAELTPYAMPVDEQRAVWQMCGFTPQNAAAHRQGFPSFPVIHGTVLAAGSGVEPEGGAGGGSGAAAAAPALAPSLLSGLQRLEGLASGEHRLLPLLPLLLVGVAAVGGAVAARRWHRRSTAPGPSLPVLLGPQAHRSPGAQR